MKNKDMVGLVISFYSFIDYIKMKNILAKLMEIQKLNLSVKKDEKNPFFKSSYISLDNLVATLTPYLNERNMLVYHYADKDCVVTVVADVETEETVMSSFPLIESNDPQKIWSCISYAKRYNLWQLFNIITDRDDDWNIASDKKVEEKKEKLVCNACWEEVSEAVAKYSKDKFDNVLCMDCQKK